MRSIRHDHARPATNVTNLGSAIQSITPARQTVRARWREVAGDGSRGPLREPGPDYDAAVSPVRPPMRKCSPQSRIETRIGMSVRPASVSS